MNPSTSTPRPGQVTYSSAEVRSRKDRLGGTSFFYRSLAFWRLVGLKRGVATIRRGLCSLGHAPWWEEKGESGEGDQDSRKFTWGHVDQGTPQNFGPWGSSPFAEGRWPPEVTALEAAPWAKGTSSSQVQTRAGRERRKLGRLQCGAQPPREGAITRPLLTHSS